MDSLSVGSGSMDWLETRAVPLIRPANVAVMDALNVKELPAASAGTRHVISFAKVVQLPSDEVTERSRAERVSICTSTTLVAVFGPWFVTIIDHRMLLFTVAGLGVTD